MLSVGLLLGAGWLAACEPEAPVEKPRSRFVLADVILTVINHSQRAVQVSLESDTLAYVMGKVARRASRSFSLPSGLSASPSLLRFKAVYDGAQPIFSDPFEVRRGQMVSWRLDGTNRGTLVKH